MQHAAQQEVTEIVINKRYVDMDGLERLEYIADGLEEFMPCPYPRMKLLAWVAAELILGKHTGSDAGVSLDIAYVGWINPDAYTDD